MKKEEEIKQFQENIKKIRTEIGKIIVGQKDVVEQVLISLMGAGHVLLEGVPGLKVRY